MKECHLPAYHCCNMYLFIVIFAISNSNEILLFERLEDSALEIKGKGELPTTCNWDYGVTRYSHLVNNDH